MELKHIVYLSLLSLFRKAVVKMPVKKGCETCDKWFYNKSSLNRHVKNVHVRQRNARRSKRQQDTDDVRNILVKTRIFQQSTDEVRNLLVKTRIFLKSICDTMEKRLKRQQDADEVRFLLVKTRTFSKILCDTVEKTNELAQRLEANIEECIAHVQPQNVYI